MTHDQNAIRRLYAALVLSFRRHPDTAAVKFVRTGRIKTGHIEIPVRSADQKPLGAVELRLLPVGKVEGNVVKIGFDPPSYFLWFNAVPGHLVEDVLVPLYLKVDDSDVFQATSKRLCKGTAPFILNQMRVSRDNFKLTWRTELPIYQAEALPTHLIGHVARQAKSLLLAHHQAVVDLWQSSDQRFVPERREK